MRNKATLRLTALVLSLVLALPPAALAAQSPVSSDPETSTVQQETTAGQDRTADVNDTATSDTQDTPAVSPETEDQQDASVPDGDKAEVPDPETPDASEPDQDSDDPADPAPAQKSVTVTYMDGTSTLSTEKVAQGAGLTQIPAADAAGAAILGWIVDGKKVTDLTSIDLSADTTVSVWHAPALISDDIPYVQGQSAGHFNPSESLTRAEAATLLYGVLQDKSHGGITATTFSDVSEDQWFYESITTLTSLGVLNGMGDGTFQPNALVTRAQYVTMVSGLFPLVQTTGSSFTDVAEDSWYRAAIMSSVRRGWIGGYEDGTFHPNDAVSRAEAVEVMNYVLGRVPSKDTVAMLREANVCPFLDVPKNNWYYPAIMEAVIPHTSTVENGYDVWTDFEYVSCGAEPGLYQFDEGTFVIDENRQIVHQTYGFHTINGKTYLSTEKNGALTIYPEGPIEMNNALYCVNKDGSFVIDDYYGYLYFGWDGKYTSGNAEVDAEVEKAMNLVITPDMTQAEKLRAAYLYVRDHCTYVNRPHHPHGSTDWYAEAALTMFRTHKGNCYCYTGAFLYMARRLGYQAYGVSGSYKKNYVDHAWVMIGDLAYDPCLEYLIPAKNHFFMDLYGIDPKKSTLLYHFP